jgi:hypothetical protein
MNLEIITGTQIIGNEFVTQIRITPQNADKIWNLFFDLTKSSDPNESGVHLNPNVTLSEPPAGIQTELLAKKGGCPTFTYCFYVPISLHSIGYYRRDGIWWGNTMG